MTLISHELLPLQFPRTIRALHQIEITSRCQLRCPYCPSPKLGRPKVDMDRATFVRTLEWAQRYVKAGTQVELNLAGIGESTLHPDFLEYLALARAAVGEEVKIVFATNGLETAKRGAAFVQAMVPYHPEVSVSLHRPEKAGIAVMLYKAHGLLEGASADPSLNANTWAGQVDWHVDLPGDLACRWLRLGNVMVMADGRITTCCLDTDGSGVVGHVNDEIGSTRVQPWRLCADCHQVIGAVGYDQYANRKVLPVIP